jgi:uncharacterized protein YlxW (UPF0749 family)
MGALGSDALAQLGVSQMSDDDIALYSKSLDELQQQRDRLKNQIAQSQETIERSQELLKRIDEILNRAGPKP